MITHAGLRYWTTDELAGSLIARGLISGEGPRREVLRRTRRWAATEDLRPSAHTKTGGLLWAEDASFAVLQHAEMNGLTFSVVPPTV